MATIVCQQQQSSCLESQTLLLKLSPPPPPPIPLFSTTTPFEFETTQQQQQHHHHQKTHLIAHHNTNTNTSSSLSKSGGGGGGWTFLQSLSGEAKPSSGEPTYVHPLNKRSAATILSDRSLELCTENLGNETGTTDTADCGILLNTWGAGAGAGEVGRRRLRSKSGIEVQRSFPPPLTTISGRDSIQVRPHREDGRLIITAVKAQSRLVSCFRADRSEEGRLRLCLWEDYYSLERESEAEAERFENEDDEVVEEEEDESEENVEDVGEIEKEKNEVGRIEKFEMVRGGRCKESGEKQYMGEKNKSVLNWEQPLLVAT